MLGYFDLVRHVGNHALFWALETSILSSLARVPLHVHVEGLRGTGKTSAIRAARGILPLIARIKGCPYNCDPVRPHCPLHRDLTWEQIEAAGTEEVPMPFLEISHSAKLGTVVGSIDLGRVIHSQSPEAALLPGVLPRAHRGIVFVDEVNRLADTSPELTDVLLDVMGTRPGRIQIEETGLPTVDMHVSVTVWAASNPDEEPGPLEDIRKQLSDRFDLVVEMGKPHDAGSVRAILTRSEACTLRLPPVSHASHVLPARPRLASGTTAFAAEGETGPDRAGTGVVAAPVDPTTTGPGGGPTPSPLDTVRKALTTGARLYPMVAVPESISAVLSETYVNFGLESLRAVEACCLAGKARAALEGRPRMNHDDLRAVLPMALRHRVDAATLASIVTFCSESRGADGGTADAHGQGQAQGRAGLGETAGPQADGSGVPGASHFQGAGQGWSDFPGPFRRAWYEILRKLGACGNGRSDGQGSGGRGQGQCPGEASGSGLRGTPGSGPGEGGFGPNPGTGGGSGVYRPGSGMGPGGGGPGSVIDPSRARLVAPPHRATPISAMGNAPLCYSEEDLSPK